MLLYENTCVFGTTIINDIDAGYFATDVAYHGKDMPGDPKARNDDRYFDIEA
jgi:hypothetical protein